MVSEITAERKRIPAPETRLSGAVARSVEAKVDDHSSDVFAIGHSPQKREECDTNSSQRIHIARAEKKTSQLAFEGYADQFALIFNLKAQWARRLKEDEKWLEEVVSAEEFEEKPEPEVTLKSA